MKALTYVKSSFTTLLKILQLVLKMLSFSISFQTVKLKRMTDWMKRVRPTAAIYASHFYCWLGVRVLKPIDKKDPTVKDEMFVVSKGYKLLVYNSLY